MLNEDDDTQVLRPVDDPTLAQVSTYADVGNIDDGEVDGGHGNRGGHGLRLLIALLVAAALIAGGVFGIQAFNSHISGLRRQQALSVCQKNLQSYDAALKQFQERVQKADEAAKITQAQVENPQTVSDLRDALDAQVPERKACPSTADRDVLNSNADQLDMGAGTLKENADTVDKAITAVSTSQSQKSLADAKDSLNRLLNSGRSVLTASEGKVADESTRTSLQDALTSAEKVVAANDISDAQQYVDSQSSLQKAIDAVNDSIKKKEEQDATHVTADNYQFDIPDYWKGRVNVKQDGDTVTVYSKSYPTRALCQLRVAQTSQMTAGDIANAMVANATLDSTRSVVVWTTRWGYVAAKSQLGDGGETLSSEEAQELVDLQTGGKVKYQQILDAESRGDGQSSDLLVQGDSFVQSTVFASLKAK